MLLSAASSSRDENERRRAEFAARLRDLVAMRGLRLLSADLGRGPENRAFWDLSLQWPGGEVSACRVSLGDEIAPYSDEALGAALAKLPWAVPIHAHG